MINMFVIVCVVVFLFNTLWWSKDGWHNVFIKFGWGLLFLYSLLVAFEVYYKDGATILEQKEIEINRMVQEYMKENPLTPTE